MKPATEVGNFTIKQSSNQGAQLATSNSQPPQLHQPPSKDGAPEEKSKRAAPTILELHHLPPRGMFLINHVTSDIKE